MGTLQEGLCTFMIISRSVLLRVKNFSEKNVAEKIKTHILCSTTFCRRSCRLWDNVGKNIVQPGGPQMTIWRMRIACWIYKATNTHSECVILIAFPLQQRLNKRASMLRNADCLSVCLAYFMPSTTTWHNYRRIWHKYVHKACPIICQAGTEGK